MINDFAPNTIVENADCLASLLPDGRLFAAKNIRATDSSEASNLRKLLTAFSGEYGRLQNKIYELSVEDDLANTTNLINEWESALGIPDTCFNTDVGIVQRRKQIVAKFALMNIITEAEWMHLAWFFGFRIKIEHGIDYNVFTMKFPIYFAGSAEAAAYTMIITFLGMTKPRNIFTCKFPIVFEDNVNFLICLFNKLKPAFINIHYRWEF